jgi:hypothetical protein
VGATRSDLGDKPYKTHHFLTETVIDRSVEVVWPHVVKIGSWMTDHELETLAGEEGKVGHFERVRPRSLDDEIAEPRYHLYGIAKVVPKRCVVLEVFPEKGGSYGDAFYPPEFINFDVILLTDLGSRTQVSFVGIDVHMEKDAIADGKFHEQIQRYFENLRDLCEDT